MNGGQTLRAFLLLYEREIRGINILWGVNVFISFLKIIILHSQLFLVFFPTSCGISLLLSFTFLFGLLTLSLSASVYLFHLLLFLPTAVFSFLMCFMWYSRADLWEMMRPFAEIWLPAYQSGGVEWKERPKKNVWMKESAFIFVFITKVEK